MTFRDAKTLFPVGALLLALALTACGDIAVPGDPAATGPTTEPSAAPSPASGAGGVEVAPTEFPTHAWARTAQLSVAAEGRVEIHFTRPGTERGEEEDPEADDAIAEAILDARLSVDLCLYEFNRPVIIDAVLELLEQRPEVAVRFVGDGDEVEDLGYEELAAVGVEMSLRRPADRIMHNKFVIIDGAVVFSGSTNFSKNGMLLNNNNVLRIESEELATAYTAEFEQMFTGGLFGRKKVALTRQPGFEVGGRDLELYFSPKDQVLDALLEELAEAQHSVFFMVFSFTHPDIAARLEELHRAGVQVVGIFDESQARGRYSVDERLALSGVPVLIDGNHNAIGFAGGKLHHKVMIIDPFTNSDPTVLAGSYNWSKSATNYNDENLLVLHGQDFAAPYVEEFCSLMAVAAPHPELAGELPDPCANLLTPLRINELLPNPDGADADEEWVEIVNHGAAAVELTGWALGDLISPNRHVFDSVVLPAGDALVVYSGPDSLGGERLVASSGALSLNNTTEVVTLTDVHGVVVDQVTYTGARSGVSFNRAVDGGLGGEFVLHSELGAPMSPGMRADGTPWLPEPPIVALVVNEVLPNPDGRDLGQEYVELVNVGNVDVDLDGWHLGDAVNGARHVFAPGTIITAGAALVVFDRGDHSDVPNHVVSSTGSLSLNNTGDVVLLTEPDGEEHDAAHYASSTSGVSLNRALDGDATTTLVRHDELPDATTSTSPGLRSDGGPWSE